MFFFLFPSGACSLLFRIFFCLRKNTLTQVANVKHTFSVAYGCNVSTYVQRDSEKSKLNYYKGDLRFWTREDESYLVLSLISVVFRNFCFHNFFFFFFFFFFDQKKLSSDDSIDDFLTTRYKLKKCSHFSAYSRFGYNRYKNIKKREKVKNR